MRHQSAGRRRRHGYRGDPPHGHGRRRGRVKKAAYGCGAFLTVIVVLAGLSAAANRNSGAPPSR